MVISTLLPDTAVDEIGAWVEGMEVEACFGVGVAEEPQATKNITASVRIVTSLVFIFFNSSMYLYLCLIAFFSKAHDSLSRYHRGAIYFIFKLV